MKFEDCKCPRVLIADDEPFNLIALEGLLHQFNVGSIDKAYHGREALNKIESNFINGSRSCGASHRPYRLIMLDKNMPIMDGVDAAIIFKKWENEKRFSHKVRLVLVTGDETIVEKEFDKTLFNFVIVKPIAQNNISRILVSANLLEPEKHRSYSRALSKISILSK